MRGLRSACFHGTGPLLLVAIASLTIISAGCGASPLNFLGKATPAPALPTLGNSNFFVVTATLPAASSEGEAPGQPVGTAPSEAIGTAPASPVGTAPAEPIGTAPAPTTTPAGAPTSPPPTIAVESLPTQRPTLTLLPAKSGTTRVKIFLIAIGDNGVSGLKLGCGDSAIAVDRDVPATKAPLTAALNELLSLHDQYYGQSGLYNSLYQSKLTLQSVAIVNGVATIKLAGTLTLGGVCDDPRVDAQLTNTALQFVTVKSADISLNGKPLKDALSGK